MLTYIQEQVIRGFGYGLSRTEVASALDLSPDQVDQLVAQAYLLLHELERKVSPSFYTSTEISTD